jgi:hypothetical protein
MTNPGGPRAVLSASARRLPAASRLDQIRAYGVVLDAGSNAEAQLHTAQVNVTLPKLAFERAQTLYGDERRISPAALQPTEAAYRTDEANVDAAQSLVRTLAATPRPEWGRCSESHSSRARRPRYA